MPTAIQYHPQKPPESCSPTLNPVADTSQTFVSPGSQRLWVSSVTTDRQFCEKLIGKLTCTLDPFLSWFPPCLIAYRDNSYARPSSIRAPSSSIPTDWWSPVHLTVIAWIIAWYTQQSVRECYCPWSRFTSFISTLSIRRQQSSVNSPPSSMNTMKIEYCCFG